jgi:hypothetical protein
VRFWLTSTPALPDGALAAAQTKGRERYEGFVEAIIRRLARGRKLSDVISNDTDGERSTIERLTRINNAPLARNSVHPIYMCPTQADWRAGSRNQAFSTQSREQFEQCIVC